MDQLYCSSSYITIYEERGAGVFNTLRDNSKFRFFTVSQRGVFCEFLLAIYKPIKALKEDCCFNTKDKKRTPNLVYYTSMETLKKILTGEPRKEELTIRLGSRMEDATVDRYVTWLKHMKRVKKVVLARPNRHTT